MHKDISGFSFSTGPTQLLPLGCVRVRQKGPPATQELKWQRDWRGLAWHADWEEATGVGWGGWESGGEASEEGEREAGGGAPEGLLRALADARRAPGAPGPRPPASGSGWRQVVILPSSASAWPHNHSQDKSTLGKAPPQPPPPVRRRARREGAEQRPPAQAGGDRSAAPRVADGGQRLRGECAAPGLTRGAPPRPRCTGPRGRRRGCGGCGGSSSLGTPSLRPRLTRVGGRGQRRAAAFSRDACRGAGDLEKAARREREGELENAKGGRLHRLDRAAGEGSGPESARRGPNLPETVAG